MQATNDLPLYREVSGAGPVVLLIPGTPGDGGQFAALAATLEHRCTVVTYDRRGTSRSPRAGGWARTTVGEHANDAAAVLAEVTDQPALVYGTSSGASIALELALSHPEQLSGVLLHEMPLLTVLADPGSAAEILGGVVGDALETGGPTAALEAFLRFALGDQLIDDLDQDLHARLLANADMIFTVEMPAFLSYAPDEAALCSLAVPAIVLVGEEQQLPLFVEASTWLAKRIGTSVSAAPGAHGPHLSHPTQLAALITTQLSGWEAPRTALGM